MILFETFRLLVRRFIVRDFDALYAICSDAQVMKYVDNGLPLSEEQVKKWIDVSLVNYDKNLIGTNAVIEKKSGCLIGYCGVIESKDVEGFEIIYGFSKDYWGRGYASEIAAAMLEYLLERKNYEYIYASIDPENTPSFKILKRLKFEFMLSKPDDAGLDTHYYKRSLQ